MKTPNFKIGDVVSFHGERGLNIARIKSILITNHGKTEYYFDGYDDYSKNEEEINLYSENTEINDKKQELPKTYAEALQSQSKVWKRFISATGYGYPCFTNGIRNFDECFSLDEKTGQSIVAFEKLIFLRDVYRQGWKPDWKDKSYKDCIVLKNNILSKEDEFNYSRVLSFQSSEIRDLFFDNFKDLIEECKEFI